MPFRLDFGGLGSGTHRTPQGGLRLTADVTRIGVFTYRLDDGSTRRELRHPDQVFAEDSLNSMEDAPITDLHHGKVTAANVSKLSVGHVRDPRPADKFVRTAAIIQDASTIAAIEKGDRKEISCGYSCDLVMTPGEYEGEHYDAVQTNIRYNHVALGPVGWGRAGKEVALHLDDNGDMSIQVPTSAPTTPAAPTQDTQTMDETINGITYKVGTPEHIQALRKSRDDAAAQVLAEKTRADSEKSRADKAEGERDAQKKIVEDSAANLTAAVTSRIELQTTAAKVLGKEYKFDGKSDRQVMIDAITKTDSKFVATEKTEDAYLRGRFESVQATPAAKQDSISKVREDAQAATSPAPGKKTPDQIRAKNRADSQNAWRQPLAKSSQKNA